MNILATRRVGGHSWRVVENTHHTWLEIKRGGDRGWAVVSAVGKTGPRAFNDLYNSVSESVIIRSILVRQ